MSSFLGYSSPANSSSSNKTSHFSGHVVGSEALSSPSSDQFSVQLDRVGGLCERGNPINLQCYLKVEDGRTREIQFQKKELLELTAIYGKTVGAIARKMQVNPDELDVSINLKTGLVTVINEKADQLEKIQCYLDIHPDFKELREKFIEFKRNEWDVSDWPEPYYYGIGDHKGVQGFDKKTNRLKNLPQEEQGIRPYVEKYLQRANANKNNKVLARLVARKHITQGMQTIIGTMLESKQREQVSENSPHFLAQQQEIKSLERVEEEISKMDSFASMWTAIHSSEVPSKEKKAQAADRSYDAFSAYLKERGKFWSSSLTSEEEKYGKDLSLEVMKDGISLDQMRKDYADYCKEKELNPVRDSLLTVIVDASRKMARAACSGNRLSPQDQLDIKGRIKHVIGTEVYGVSENVKEEIATQFNQYLGYLSNLMWCDGRFEKGGKLSFERAFADFGDLYVEEEEIEVGHHPDEIQNPIGNNNRQNNLVDDGDEKYDNFPQDQDDIKMDEYGNRVPPPNQQPDQFEVGNHIIEIDSDDDEDDDDIEEVDEVPLNRVDQVIQKRPIDVDEVEEEIKEIPQSIVAPMNAPVSASYPQFGKVFVAMILLVLAQRYFGVV